MQSVPDLFKRTALTVPSSLAWNDQRSLCSGSWRSVDNYIYVESFATQKEWHAEMAARQSKQILHEFAHTNFAGAASPNKTTRKIHPMSRCERSLGEGQVLLIERSGPVVSHAGNWHHFAGHGAALPETLSDNHMYYATRMFMGAVDSSGKIFGYPPLEMHHLHLSPSNLQTELAFQSHSDTQCSRPDGVRCLIWDMPAGYGVRMQTPKSGGYAFGVINDVRRSAAPLPYWIEIGLIVTDRAKRPMSVVTVTNPYSINSILNFGVDAFPHAAASESFHWYSARLKHGGTYSTPILHSHWEWTSELLVFAASPSQLGLSDPRLRPKRPWEEIILAERGLIAAEIREHIMTNLNLAASKQGTDAPRLVASSSDALDWEVSTATDDVTALSATGLSARGDEDLYPRTRLNRTDALSRSFSARKGDVLTIVSFHRPLTKEHASAGRVQMHTGFMSYFIDADEGKHSCEYTKGSTNPDFTWYSLYGSTLHSKEQLLGAAKYGGGPYGPDKDWSFGDRETISGTSVKTDLLGMLKIMGGIVFAASKRDSIP